MTLEQFLADCEHCIDAGVVMEQAPKLLAIIRVLWDANREMKTMRVGSHVGLYHRAVTIEHKVEDIVNKVVTWERDKE